MRSVEPGHGLTAIVDPEAALERLATGYIFTEGPVWDPVESLLVFNDVPGDVRSSWRTSGEVAVVKRPTNKANGMAFDGSGRLLICEHVTSRVVRQARDGTTEVLASQYGDKELNSPNDVIVSLDGTVYFTDPSYGRADGFGLGREVELTFRGVYRLRPGHTKVELVADDFDQPNGLCLSPDESVLYVNDTPRAHIRSFPVRRDGSIGPGSLFFGSVGTGAIADGVVDGMKCDRDGNVFVTGPGGIWVIDAGAALLGVIPTPETPGNLNWGGTDWSTLFLACSSSVYCLETLTSAAPVPNVRRGRS